MLRMRVSRNTLTLFVVIIFSCGFATSRRTTTTSLSDRNEFNYNHEEYNNRHHQQQQQYSKSNVHNQRKYYQRRMERRNEQQNVEVTNEKHYASPRIVILGATGNSVTYTYENWKY